MINEKQLSIDHQNFIHEYYVQTVSPALVTIILNDLAEFPLLKDTSGYLAVKLVMKTEEKAKLLGLVKPKKEIRYAVIEIPKTLSRFVVLPSTDDKKYIILLDDVIRFSLSSIFNI